MRDLFTKPVDHLGRRPNCERVSPPVIFGDYAAALHRHSRVAVVHEAALDPVRRLFHGGCNITLLGVQFGYQIAAEIGMDDRGATG